MVALVIGINRGRLLKLDYCPINRSTVCANIINDHGLCIFKIIIIFKTGYTYVQYINMKERKLIFTKHNKIYNRKQH